MFFEAVCTPPHDWPKIFKLTSIVPADLMENLRARGSPPKFHRCTSIIPRRPNLMKFFFGREFYSNTKI